MIMLCKIGESHQLGTLVKNVAGVILAEGGINIIIPNVSGVVRGIDNLGDRVISKNMKAKDGQKYGVVRYI